MGSKAEDLTIKYLDLISLENLFQAWNEFKKGKRKRRDVQEFERFLEDNLFQLYLDLKDRLTSMVTILLFTSRIQN